jgi:YebC/PmpR family DNA-binding regulatory protein
MAGHNKWKQIKHKKAILDAKKGKLFTKLIKEITVAARMGGGDPHGNARLRFLLEKGKEINMPQENAARAIKKGTGELPGVSYESFTYEGYGPSNIAVIIEVLTDNKNRAIAEMRHVFSRNNASLASEGSVSWMFQRSGVIQIAQNGYTEDMLIDALLDFDVQDIKLEDGKFYIYTQPKSLEDIKQALIKHLGCPIEEAELEWVASNKVELDEAQEEKAVEFLQALEDLEDVQNVYTNLA